MSKRDPYRAVGVSAAAVTLTEFLSGVLVFAWAYDTVSCEGQGEIGTIVPDKLVLLETGETDLHIDVVERCSEDEWRPIADWHLLVSTPGASLALWNTLLVDVVMCRGGLAVPEEILALIRVRKLASLARL